MTEQRVPVTEWVAAAQDRADQGYLLDALVAVDEHDRPGPAGPAGLDVVAQLVRPPAPAADRTEVRADAVEGRVALWTRVPEGDELPSLSDVWPGAAWLERAAADLSGLRVAGGSRARLLLPESYEGPAPLSKKMPVAARGSTPWPGRVEPGERQADVTGGATDSSAAGLAAPRRTRRRQVPPGAPTEWPA